jgi:hypothetical protein
MGKGYEAPLKAYTYYICRSSKTALFTIYNHYKALIAFVFAGVHCVLFVYLNERS